MPDPTNDIEALLDLLAAQSRFGFHSALTALVAERDALKQRAAELEARAKPVYITDGQRVESIDLRERLVCAALTGILAHEGRGQRFVVEDAVWYAANALAAMRKGDTNA